MNIGEFFLEIGIKGTEKTIGALGSVRSGLSGLTDVSLEAKAAILAAVYAFERLMTGSAQAGTKLANFNALTGLSTQTLQQYQYAAAQVGVSNEEVAGSFKGIQNVMTQMRLGQGAPAGLSLLASKVQFDPKKAQTDIKYTFDKLQEYALKEQDIGTRNFVLKSFGVGEGAVGAMARNAFRPEVLKRAPTYGDSEIRQLDKANAAWTNLGMKVQMAFGHFNAAHGAKLVGDLSHMTDGVIKLVNALVRLIDKIHGFEALGFILEKTASVIGFIADKTGEVPKELAKPKTQIAKDVGQGAFRLGKEAVGGVASLGSKLADQVPGMISFGKTVASSFADQFRGTKLPSLSNLLPRVPALATAPGGVGSQIRASSVVPAISPGPERGGGKTQNNNVNQTFNFQNDGSNAKQVGDETQRAITRAYFQIQQGGI